MQAGRAQRCDVHPGWIEREGWEIHHPADTKGIIVAVNKKPIATRLKTASTPMPKVTRARAVNRVTNPKSKPIIAKNGATPAPQKSVLRKIFEGAGFKHVPADNLHFTMDGRQSEIDHIFVWENVILLCEETTEAKPSKHCTNKMVFHGKIAADYNQFYDTYCPINPALMEAVGTMYARQDLEVRHIYFSETADVSVGSSAPLLILTRAQAKYFTSLVDTIERSAKYELLKYLGIALHQIGSERVSGNSVPLNSFPAFALPAAHTSYPPGFAVVSFYADPMALITRSYVLRRDGWENPDLSYQRFVKSEKLVAMRDYLAGNGKVFINNLVVTLPSSALLTDADTKQPVTPAALTNKTQVQLHLPQELGTVGIVDGQHRVLSYYEGSGETEAAINRLRLRQNLLVTGIIFPPSYTPEMRVKFEAEIFLGINSNQSPVNTQLQQDLEAIINPEKPIAIARVIVTKLSKQGPLAGLMAMSQFDPPEKIASGSLGRYVVENLVKQKSAFYGTWDSAGIRDMTNAQDRAEFINYAVAQLERLLQAAAAQMKEKFRSVPNGGVLSTTAVGGLLLLMDRLVKSGRTPSSIDYSGLFKNFDQVDFRSYSGSGWGKLSRDLEATFPPPPVRSRRRPRSG